MSEPNQRRGIIGWVLHYRPLAIALLLLGTAWGLYVAPFNWANLTIPRDPVPVDAIPDIGENQQIVFTNWMGHSPRDIEDQITYPLTTALLGLPGVETVRGYSYFGFSTIYLIFDEDTPFYESRSRILEKLAALPAGLLPQDVNPTLGPDATALGQVFWYTLEGRDPDGNPTGGWDLHELRSIQDWQVRYALLAAGGVAEVASVGGHVQEYQVDVDPDAMRAQNITLAQVFAAIRQTNRDAGARNLEINGVEYFVRGVGLVEAVEDLEEAVIVARDDVPVRIRDIARVTLGPAQRRGMLDKEGVEAVGGVVVARFGENPMAVIDNIKAKLAELAPSLPHKILPDGTQSKVAVVPFYDRSELIDETLDTLETALLQQMGITVIVILVMLLNVRGAALVSALLPLSVLLTFLAMRYTGVQANIVALSGIAIAIGSMVDMGIVMVENIARQISERKGSLWQAVYRGASEVSGAVLTAVATTVISFLPVFTMEAAEGKLFKPLAFTKTYALIAALIVSLLLIPALGFLLAHYREAKWRKTIMRVLIACLCAGFLLFFGNIWLALLVALLLSLEPLRPHLPQKLFKALNIALHLFAACLAAIWLADAWLPLGPTSTGANRGFVLMTIVIVLGFFMLVYAAYEHVLRFIMKIRLLFLLLPIITVFFGAMIWLGAATFTQALPQSWQQWKPVVSLNHALPGLGKEFMPPLDEGSYLFMPTTSVHAAINEGIDMISKQDQAISALPEVETAVGKLGRAESPLDPAPLSMIETVINYTSAYLEDDNGDLKRFRWLADETDWFRNVIGDPVPAADGEPYVVKGRFERDDAGRLIEDPDGRPFRLWRPALDPDLNEGRAAWPGIQTADDIWEAIVDVSAIPGVTSAPKLQPIAARIVMLQSGMRAPMGLKVKGPDLATIERAALMLEQELKKVPALRPETVIADRIVGKPYLEIELDRRAIARHGLTVEAVQQVLAMAIGGMPVTQTVEGRERYQVQIRYPRHLRDHPEDVMSVLVTTPSGAHLPLKQFAQLSYRTGPQVIKNEDAFPVAYVLFDKQKDLAEVDAVEQTRQFLEDQIASGALELPQGVRYVFAGNYQNQVRATQKLALILPLAFILIFCILYLQFRAISTTFMVFSTILVAWSGGFIMLWLYDQNWFMNINYWDVNLRDLLDMGTIHLSVAVWVGFLALFGIASDDGVLMATYLHQQLRQNAPTSLNALNEAIIAGACKRVRPALMTSATTVLALLPVLTATGRGADVMRPMAIPTFGGMLIVTLTLFVIPVLFSLYQQLQLPPVHSDSEELSSNEHGSDEKEKP
jgi:Cu(I)/Ag(I) efflux system membrane protein CusA/SilA